MRHEAVAAPWDIRLGLLLSTRHFLSRAQLIDVQCLKDIVRRFS